MAESYVSLKIIGDRLLRNNVMSGISWESIVDYFIDFIGLVGLPMVYDDKLYEGKLVNYRLQLPCDFIEEKQVLIASTKHFNNKNNFVPARYATDTFHGFYDDTKLAPATEFTYSINNNYLFSSVSEGLVKMEYKSIMTDEEGYPMIPDNRTFINAFEWFVKYKYYNILWDEGKLEDKRFYHAQQEYYFAVAQAETDARRLSLGKAESLFNNLSTLRIRNNEFARRFANMGRKEFIKVH